MDTVKLAEGEHFSRMQQPARPWPSRGRRCRSHPRVRERKKAVVPLSPWDVILSPLDVIPTEVGILLFFRWIPVFGGMTRVASPDTVAPGEKRKDCSSIRLTCSAFVRFANRRDTKFPGFWPRGCPLVLPRPIMCFGSLLEAEGQKDQEWIRLGNIGQFSRFLPRHHS